MKKAKEILEYGPVYIKSGQYKGRIGYYDDEDVDKSGRKIAYIYTGLPLISDEIVAFEKDITKVNTDVLFRRQEELTSLLMDFHFKATEDREDSKYKEHFSYLNEYNFIEAILHENFIKARFLRAKEGTRVFISHSSKDKTFAKYLATDLSKAGLIPWLDEWNIKVGESIPQSISVGLSDCEYVLVILSPNSIESNWVQNEWQSKYWDEISEGNIKVIPVLLKSCNIPRLLKTKK